MNAPPRNSAKHVLSLFAVALCAGCVSVGDYTVGRSDTCENHRVAMTPKRVKETYGMKAGFGPLDLARPNLFPHADEPYDTGACMRAYTYSSL